MFYRLFPLRVLLFLLFLITISSTLLATHNRAGEIRVELVDTTCTSDNSLTVRATVITYTKASSISVDRDTLTICWGDGTCERVGRANGLGTPPQGVILENDTKRNLYIATHTYSARATYTISMTDPNRNAGILNVNAPFSEQVPFHIQTEYTFLNPQVQGCNNSPILLQPPIDIGCVGQVFTHNPNAFDADNDSLSYEFITPMQEVDFSAPNYQEVMEIEPGIDNQITIDSLTGDIVWNAPQKAGEYNIAILIREYRNGQQIGSIVRDMQILVEECENLPPVVEVPFDEVCVIAGNVLEFDVRATAPLSEDEQLV
ncbi:MAG: gliding motility-associated C-terminal domain-containing protein, partial [bacterium]|nr:gliding motility-associated C-terminal domain-containing protein [bacterium]